MKAGDLIETTCFGPEGSVGELGVLLSETWEGDCWEVYFNVVGRVELGDYKCKSVIW